MIDPLPLTAVLAGDVVGSCGLVMSCFVSLLQLGKEIDFLLGLPDGLTLRLDYLFLHPHDDPLLVSLL